MGVERRDTHGRTRTQLEVDPLNSSPEDDCDCCTESWANRSEAKNRCQSPSFQVVQRKGSRDNDSSVNPVVVGKLSEDNVWSEGARGVYATAGVEDAAQLREEERESDRDRRNRTCFSTDRALFDRYDQPVGCK